MADACGEPPRDLQQFLSLFRWGKHRLLVARNALNPQEVKYFISDAPEATPVKTLLRVAFARWTIERAFEDSKTELGMDHFEVCKFQSIQRHLIISCVSHVFLSEFCLKHRGEKPRPDAVPGTNGNRVAGSALVQRRTLFPTIRQNHRRAIEFYTTTNYQSPPQPSTAYH